jgi:Na+/phosphate symporter
MTPIQGLFAAVSAVLLFLYGLQGFSRELQDVGGASLQSWLGRVTASRWLGFLVGALATAIMQSSSAITALAVTLVDASVISFRASLGVLLGSNVGTTATAWLVSFKLTGIGPVFIVLGALITLLPIRARVVGKAVFYFGLIFFALDLISAELKPLQNRPQFHGQVCLPAGLVFTALVQSSSVTTGLAILLVQQGLLPPQAAIPIVIGANMGSTWGTVRIVQFMAVCTEKQLPINDLGICRSSKNCNRTEPCCKRLCAALPPDFARFERLPHAASIPGRALV